MTKCCLWCGKEKTAEDFRLQKMASGNKRRSSSCRECENNKYREAARLREKARRERDPDKARKKAREYIRERRRKDRIFAQEMRRKERARKGKTYHTIEEWRNLQRTRKTERMAQKAEHIKKDKGWGGGRDGTPITSRVVLIERLRHECPDRYDPSMNLYTLIARARYIYDDEYRAKEIEKARVKRAKRRGMTYQSDGTLSPIVIASLFARKNCPYCNNDMSSKDKTLDHIIPLSRGGRHSIHNVIVCCRSCNTIKHARTIREWRGKEKQIAIEFFGSLPGGERGG